MLCKVVFLNETQRSWVNFRFSKMLIFSEELLAPHPTPKLEEHPLSAVRDCLFNIFATTLHLLHSQQRHAPWHSVKHKHPVWAECKILGIKPGLSRSNHGTLKSLQAIFVHFSCSCYSPRLCFTLFCTAATTLKPYRPPFVRYFFENKCLLLYFERHGYGLANGQWQNRFNNEISN